MHNKSDVSTRLVKAAIRVIETEGEVGVRLHDLSREVGVAISAVYNYFGNRDGLIVAAQKERYATSAQDLQDWFVEATKSCQSREDYRKLMDVTLGKVTDPARAERRLTRVAVIGSSVGRPLLTQAILDVDREHVEVLGAALQYAQDKNWMRTDIDAKAAVMWWWGLVNARVSIELGGAVVSMKHWDDLFREASFTLFFGGLPAADTAAQ